MRGLRQAVLPAALASALAAPRPPLQIFPSDNVFLIQGYGFSGPFGPPFGINLNLGIIPFDQPGSYGSFFLGETGGGPPRGSNIHGAQTFTGPITLTVLSSGTP